MYLRLKKFISVGIIAPCLVGLGLVAGTAAPVSAATASTTATTSTTINETPIKWSTTNGDILDTAVFTDGTDHYVAIGGNFTAVITPDGVSHAAKNFAVLREETGAVVYSGNANSYVRVVHYFNGRVYVGGDFTAFGGVTRHYIAAVATSNWGVSTWNPNSSNPVHALEASTNLIYYGTGPMARAVSTSTGATVWTDKTTGGATKAMLLTPDASALYVGGLFSGLGDFANHALVRVNAATGAPDTSYKPVLQPNSGVGSHGSFDGQNVLAMTWETAYSPARLMASIGGTWNDLISFSTASGNKYWDDSLQGDGQDTVIIGDEVIVGTHRNKGGTATDEGAKWFNGAFRTSDGATADFDAKLSGTQNNADGGNNGIQALAQSSVTNRLYVMGAFTYWNQICNYNTLVCTGGTPLKSIAVYTYTP